MNWHGKRLNGKEMNDQVQKKPEKFVARIFEGGETLLVDNLTSILNALDHDGYDLISILPNTYSTRDVGLQVTRTSFILVGKLKEDFV